MSNLSLSQEYMMCALNDKGKISTFSLERVIAVAASAVAELMMDDVIESDGKKLSVKKALPEDMRYLSPVYDFIEKKGRVGFRTVVEHFSFTLSSKNIDELFDSIGESLVAAGCAQKEKSGMLGNKNAYIPDKKAVDTIIQNIRAEILEDGELTEDIAALTAILDKTGELMRFFSAYEKKDVKKRLKEIKNDPENKDIAKVINYVEELMMIIIVSAT